MWRNEREKLIRDRLESRGRVSIAELVEATGISRETLRADLEAMAARGGIERVRGGAVIAAASDPEADFHKRLHHRMAEKLAIGQAAERLLPHGASVMVDAGSTTAAFAKALSGRTDLRIVTNSLLVARTLAASHDTVLLGGVPDRAGQGTYGETALAQLRRFRADVAVISPVGVEAEAGLTDYQLCEAELAAAMFDQAERRIVLAHGEKLGQTSRVVIAPLSAVDLLVTDAVPAGWPDMPRVVVA